MDLLGFDWEFFKEIYKEVANDCEIDIFGVVWFINKENNVSRVLCFKRKKCKKCESVRISDYMYRLVFWYVFLEINEKYEIWINKIYVD